MLNQPEVELVTFTTEEFGDFRLRLLCGAGGYPPNVLQPTEAYCTNPTLVSPFISRGAAYQTT
jgi:hypothetical protein